MRLGTSTRRRGGITNPPNCLVGHLGWIVRKSCGRCEAELLSNDLRLQRHAVLDGATSRQLLKAVQVLLHAALGEPYPFSGYLLNATSDDGCAFHDCCRLPDDHSTVCLTVAQPSRNMVSPRLWWYSWWPFRVRRLSLPRHARRFVPRGEPLHTTFERCDIWRLFAAITLSLSLGKITEGQSPPM